MKKIYLCIATLAMVFSASAQLDFSTYTNVQLKALVDVPASLTGDVQVIMANGVAVTQSTAEKVGFTYNTGGYAEVSDVTDFTVAAGNRYLDNDGILDLGATYQYCVIKIRLASGKEVVGNVDVNLGIRQDAAGNKKVWEDWTDGTSTVPALTEEWQNVVFNVTTDITAWTRVAFEKWVGGYIEIEDIWFSVNKPDFSVVVEPLNYSDLQDKVDQIEAEFEALAGSDDPEEVATALAAKYTLASLTAFNAKYEVAKALLATKDAEEQSEINAVLSELSEAYTALDLLTAGLATLSDDGSTVAGYYSILGAKLSEEPASGIFIVKYANGKAAKVVK